jgi:predicted ABC-type exoprotein transport system permease subunit
MLHYTVIGMLWLCVYPISHYLFPSCSCSFHSVYIVLILNFTPVLGYSCKSCLWCLLLSGLLVCCDSFFLVMYPVCFLHCTSAAAVVVFWHLFLHTVCAAILNLHYNWRETQKRDHSTTEIHLHSLLFRSPSTNFLKKHDLSEAGSPFSSKETSNLMHSLDWLFSITGHHRHSNLLWNVPENSGQSIVTGK